MRLILSIAIACLMPQAAGAAHFGDALAAYFLEDYAKAEAEWRELALEGDPDSQFYLGLLYETGRGVEQDPDTAFDWYMKAAEGGHAEAAYRLAHMVRKISARKAAPNSVLQWIEKAAMGGIAEAQYELAALYAEGRMVERDLEKAGQWFAAAEKSFTDDARRRQAASMRQLVEARLNRD